MNWRDDPAILSNWGPVGFRPGVMPALDTTPLARASAIRRFGTPVATFTIGLGLAVAGLSLFGPGSGQSAPRQALAVPAMMVPALAVPALAVPALAAAPPMPAITEARLEMLSQQAAAQAARAQAAAAQAEAISQRAERLLAESAPQTDRFLVATLLLRASITTPRPWLREYQTMAALAPPGALAPPLAEVLASHAARGLPSEAELRHRFAMLAPLLLARAPREATLFSRTIDSARSLLAGIGLVAPPDAGLQETAIAGIEEHLRRGNLAGAVADAGGLDAGLQPLLAGWLAQARARMAVEQAVQETLLRVLGGTAAPNPTLTLARRPS